MYNCFTTSVLCYSCLYFFNSMWCRKCNTELDDQYHDLCRGHAYCARGPQYYAEACVVCEELWERAGNISDPEGAIAIFKVLKRWIAGFRKNSRRRAYQELTAIHANLRAIAKSDSSTKTARVSTGKCNRSSYGIYIYIYIWFR